MYPGKPIIQRRYDLDWLRIFAIFSVFIFHSGRFFDQMDWHVKNPLRYQGMQTWTMFLVTWIMPLIFVISGASIYLALGKVGNFIKNKILRLLVPLIFGVFTHISFCVYLERITHHQFSGSFFDFYPQYFQGLYGEGGNFAWMGLHLWYLLVLFVFSIVLLPFFFWLKGPGKRFWKGVGNFFALPGMVYLLAVPVAWIMIQVKPYSILGERAWGGWNLLGYIPFFIYGFLILSHDGLQTRMKKSWVISLGLALMSTAAILLANEDYGHSIYGTQGYAIINGLFGVTAWLWVVTILGFGMNYLNIYNKFISYANEAVLPFYILHQTVLLIVGYFVTQWQISSPAKFAIISLSSLIIIFMIYELLIRRITFLRILFGMKPSQTIAKTKTAFKKSIPTCPF